MNQSAAIFRCTPGVLASQRARRTLRMALPPKYLSTVGCAARTIPPQTRPDKTKRYFTHKHSNSAGFSYVEVLVATVLIAIVLVPAMESLLPGVAGSGIHETFAEDHYQLTGRLEEILAEPYGDLDAAGIVAGNETTPTTYTDVFIYTNGRQITRNIFISRYDGDNADADNNPFTGTDDGLLWVSATIVGSALRLETLTSVYD